MRKAGMTGGFPSQVVSDLEKMTTDYGLQVGKAIEKEWFDRTNYRSKYLNAYNDFHRLRLYARGEQSIQKYKDELSINGDLSYLNLDWKPVPIIPKFVDIVVNGISERMYDIKAFSQDPFGVSQRTEYMDSLLGDMQTKSLNELVEETLGMSVNENDKMKIPGSEEELELHMQLSYKQAVEIAEEQAINTLLEANRYELIKKQFYYDLTVLGMGATKTSFNASEGVKVEYVDPASLVYSYTESPYFEDIYYVGEVKEIPINELVKQFPDLKHEDLEDIIKNNYNYAYDYGGNFSARDNDDSNKIKVLYFNYKTYTNEVYKMKETKTGGKKAIEKDDQFNPPQEMEGDFIALKRCIEVLFEGALVLGTDKLLKWGMAKNMMRPKSDVTKVKMNYTIVAPRMYNGRIESLVSRITGFADMIQLTHLKLQQVMARLVPDGIYLDADGLAEIDLGNGTNYNPQEALNMYFQTGSIIGRSFTSDGDMNPGKMPIQEIQTNNGGGKMQSLIQTYNYYLQMIRDTTGLNEARDAATPDKYSLVGVQKLAAANSNTATRHILQAGLFITQEIAEQLSLRISDIIEYSPTKDAFIQQIGAHNVATLDEMKELHLRDFGIFIDLMPDEEEKQLLENNIQAAIAQQSIDLEDAIDVREIRSVKLANQMLKLRRKKKLERDQKMKKQQIEMQNQAQIQAQQASAQMEIQKKQSESQSMQQLEQIKAQYEAERMTREAQIKKDLLNHEFEMQIRLAKLNADAMKAKEDSKEDRKDERTKIQATQQSQLIDQRKKDSGPKVFETPKEESKMPKLTMRGLGQ